MPGSDGPVPRERASAKLAASVLVVFSLIAVPAVLYDGARSGRWVGFAPSVAAATLWVVLTARMVRHAHVCAGVPEDLDGLRAALKSRRAIDPFGVTLGLCVFFAAWMPWKLHTDWPMYAAEPQRALIGIGGFAVLAGGVLWLFARAMREVDQELAALDLPRVQS